MRGRETALIDRLPLIFYYHRYNRYSFNALAGALDNHPDLGQLPIRLAKTPEELRAAAAGLLERHDRVIIALSVLTLQMEEMRSLLRDFRSEHGPRVIAIAGGPHATAYPDAVLQEVDVMFFVLV